MPLLLGIDTGGTFTDAVLYDEAATPKVRAKAKALTTHGRLADGVGAAMNAVLDQTAGAAEAVALASVSTTLATNALVEGQGGRVGLIFIGFAPADLQRAGLAGALGDDPHLLLTGGHDAMGEPAAPLDRATLEASLEPMAAMVEAFAVVGQFGVRNPEHELACRDFIRARVDRPVTCGHELSAKLGGPKRALTTVLNARLIGLISQLIAAVEQAMATRGLSAPLMLVRGDGSLVSAAFAKGRPIETILSGPAASLVGAAALTGAADALVSDIGGTTTDVAALIDGRPAVSASGAVVGGHETMVEAVRMDTHGLGGDSEVRIDETALTPHLLIGPRRVLPLCRLAAQSPDAVYPMLERQAQAPAGRASDGELAVAGPRLLALPPELRQALPDLERALLDAVEAGPTPMDALFVQSRQKAAFDRLVSRGLAAKAGFTPTDAAHVLGRHAAWDAQAARQAARLYARKSDRRGKPTAPTGEAFAEMCLKALRRRSAEAVLATAFRQDGVSTEAARSELVQIAFNRHDTATFGAARVDIGVARPLIGLGASAATHYPAIASLLGAEAVIPDHADVANAVGAVAGRVEIKREAVAARLESGGYRVHAPDAAPVDCATLDAAVAAADDAATAAALREAQAAGADEITLTRAHWRKTAEISGSDVVIEAGVTVSAAGRPKLAPAAGS